MWLSNSSCYTPERSRLVTKNAFASTIWSVNKINTDIPHSFLNRRVSLFAHQNSISIYKFLKYLTIVTCTWILLFALNNDNHIVWELYLLEKFYVVWQNSHTNINTGNCVAKRTWNTNTVPFISNACAAFHAHINTNIYMWNTCTELYVYAHSYIHRSKYTKRTINAFKLIYFLSATELDVSNHRMTFKPRPQFHSLYNNLICNVHY